MTLRLNGSSSGHTEIKAPAAAGDNTITLPTSNGSAEQFVKNSGTAGELEFSSMVETSTGIGIGTTDPKRHLHINGGNESTKIQITNQTTGSSTDGDGFQIGIATDGTANIEQREDADLAFITNNTERMRLTSDGKLGIAHSTPQFGLTLAQSSNDSGALGWEDGSNNKRASIRCSTSNDGLQFTTGTNDDLRLQILSNGRLEAYHVYSTAIGGSTRDVHIEDGGQMGYISSIRESKENISLLNNVDWLYQLQPSSFNYKKRDRDGEYTGEISTELEYGLIAEDVEPIAPELCFYDEVEGEMELRGIHYKKLIVPLLKALQEANAKITTLETKVAALEAA